jgi:uncharacterized protein YegP (UPF0339 family)
MTLELYKSTAPKTKGQFGWRLLARNGKIIAIGGETYKRKATMMRVLQSAAWAMAFNIRDLTK